MPTSTRLQASPIYVNQVDLRGLLHSLHSRQSSEPMPGSCQRGEFKNIEAAAPEYQIRYVCPTSFA